MKRKVIQIADSTQLISLPRKWAIKHGIKKGDELDLQEEGNKVIVQTGKSTRLDKIELDITNMDRSSIMYYIRSAYKIGYDEIAIKFNNAVTDHLRINKKVNVLSAIHTEVNRLVGVEIIRQTENFCLVKCISEGSINEFGTVLRRIFLLLKDASNDLVNAIKNRDYVLAETIEQKHDSITKFASYCLRLLNMYGYVDSKNTIIMYHLISNIDKITDILKYVARDVLSYKPHTKVQTNDALDSINNCIKHYIELFYKFETNRVVDFMRDRDKADKLIKSNLKNMSKEEVKFLSNMEEILEILLDLVEARMGLGN